MDYPCSKYFFTKTMHLRTQRCATAPDEKHNRLDIAKKGNLRLLMTDMNPQIELLLAEHQAQASHWTLGCSQG